MRLSEIEQKILAAIREGKNSEEAIANYLDVDCDRVNYHLENLDRQGYIKGARGFSYHNVGRKEYQSCQLTPKGNTALNNPEDIREEKSMSENRTIYNMGNYNEKGEKKQQFNEPVGSVDNQGTQHNVAGVNRGIQSSNTQDQDLHAAIQEIRDILQPLEASNPSTMVEQMNVATEAIKYIEGNKTLKQRAINAAKGGLMEGLKQTPVGAIVAGAIEGWTQED